MCAADIDIPRLVDMAMLNDLKIDRLVTNKFSLKEINDVANKMNKRQIRGRWVLEWD
jgi:Zn-dependent alcohol dehydrogenase